MSSARMASASLEARYAHNPACKLTPVFGHLNDWKRVKFIPGKPDEGADESDCDGSESDCSSCGDQVLLDVTEELALSVDPDVDAPYRVAIDAKDDPDAAGSDEGRFYIMDPVSTAYHLDEDFESDDWGTLEKGHLVLDLKHTNLADAAKGWYTPNPAVVKAPPGLLLAVGVGMASAWLPRWCQGVPVT